MAHHDSLTDLPNRTAFNECIAATLDIAKASGESFALLSVDIDRFKTFNDVFGHSVGDRLLREIAGRLESACQGAFVARVGGDEFQVITPTGPQPETAEALAENLSAALDTDIDIDGYPLRVGLTVGVAVFPQDGADAVNSDRQCGRRLVPRQDGGARHHPILPDDHGQSIARQARAAAGSALGDRARPARAALSALHHDRRRRSSASRRWCAGIIRRAA